MYRGTVLGWRISEFVGQQLPIADVDDWQLLSNKTHACCKLNVIIEPFSDQAPV